MKTFVNPLMKQTQIKKLDEELDLVYESFECPTKSMVMLALETLSTFGMCADPSVKNNGKPLASKIENLLTKHYHQKKIANCFTTLQVRLKLARYVTHICFAVLPLFPDLITQSEIQ